MEREEQTAEEEVQARLIDNDCELYLFGDDQLIALRKMIAKELKRRRDVRR